jgi:hypothetical protein
MLTDDQKILIEENYQATDLVSLTKTVFNDLSILDGRNPKVREVKAYIVSIANGAKKVSEITKLKSTKAAKVPTLAPAIIPPQPPKETIEQLAAQDSSDLETGEENTKGDTAQPEPKKLLSGVVYRSANTTRDRAFELNLSPQQEETVKNAYMGGMKALEIARLLFSVTGPNGEPPKEISFNSAECHAVARYLRKNMELTVQLLEEEQLEREDLEYTPPKNIQSLFSLVNRYVPNRIDANRASYGNSDGKMKEAEKVQLNALLSYIKTIKFIHTASTFTKKRDREMFVSTFIWHCHDKPDLSSEEQDQYIAVASETVNINQVQRHIRRMEDMIEESLSNPDEKNKLMSLSWLEQMNQSRTKYDSAKDRLKKLQDSLNGTRSDRLKDQVKRNQSVVPLLMLWTKEESRRSMLKIAQLEQEADGREQDRLESVDDVQALIAGMTRSEARHGLQ